MEQREERKIDRDAWFSVFLRTHFEKNSAFPTSRNSSVPATPRNSSVPSTPSSIARAALLLKDKKGISLNEQYDVRMDVVKLDQRRRFEKYTMRHLKAVLTEFFSHDIRFKHDEFLNLCEHFTPLELLLNDVQRILLAIADRFSVAPDDFGKYLLSRAVPLAVCFPSSELENLDAKQKKERSFLLGDATSTAQLDH